MEPFPFCRDWFSPGVKQRGWDYALSGRVRIAKASANALVAYVRGTHPYVVSIQATQRKALLSCDCEFYAGGEFCKHLWAAMVVAAQNGHLSELLRPGYRPVFEGPGDEGDWGDDESDLVEQMRPGSRMPPESRSPSQQPRNPQSASWRSLFHETYPSQQAAREAQSQRGERQVFYWMNADDVRNSGQFRLHAGLRKRLKNGGWSLGSLKLRDYPYGAAPMTQEDHSVLGLLLPSRSYGARYWEYDEGTFPLNEAQLNALLPLLCGTKRFFAWDTGMELSELSEPLTWDEGAPWRVVYELSPTPEGAWLVRGEIVRDSERMILSDPPLILASGFLFRPGIVSRLRLEGPWSWVLALRQGREIRVPGREVEVFRKQAIEMSDPPRIEWPETLRLSEERPRPVPLLRAAKATDRENYLLLEVSFDYLGVKVLANEPRPRMVESGRVLVRDMEFEQAARQKLLDAGAKQAYEGLTVSSGRFLPLVRATMEAGWKVEAEGGLLRRAGTFRMDVSSGVDWFELNGAVDFGDEKVPLPRLLEAVRHGQHFVRLGDGSVGLLPEEWMTRMGFALDSGEIHGEAIRFKPSQALLLDALLASGEQATCDEAFSQLRSRLAAFDGIAPVEPPADFHGNLRPYQKQGLGWMTFLRDFRFGGCLADDMGLGKTVEVLALLAARKKDAARPSLVVVPRSLIFNWKAEAERFSPKLRLLDHSVPSRERGLNHPRKFDVVLTTYGTLRRDITGIKDFEFDYVILDESQAIKNASTASSKAARLLKSRHRLALSGTPVENHLGELWSLFEFLNPGMLGRVTHFKREFGSAERADTENARMLGRILRPFILRRTKSQVAKDLPEKVEQTILFDLEGHERSLYEELKKHYRREFLGKGRELSGREKIHVLEGLLRLRQAACHPGLLNPKYKEDLSTKLNVLLERLTEIVEEGHKALIFSQFTSFLALLRPWLERKSLRYEYLDGQTRDREERVKRFQSDPECPLFLISLKAGGQGLNLTAAGHVFLLDPWWNPAVEAQAIDRTHRIGQTQNVFAFRLVARGTVEEKVIELQGRKKEIADAILTEDNASLHRLTRADLEILLS